MSSLTHAFERVLAHPEDRQAQTFLLAAEGELRYEALRKGIHEDSPQTFKYCIDRLIETALIKRRLVERGRRYESHLSLSRAGRKVAKALVSLSQEGTIPRDLPDTERRALQQAFVRPVSKPTEPVRAKGMPSKRVLKAVVEKIVELAHPKKIILFGSAARGTMGPDSDLDLLIIQETTRRREAARAIRGVVERIPPYYPTDVVVVTPGQVERFGDMVGYVLRSALQEGKVLYAQ